MTLSSAGAGFGAGIGAGIGAKTGRRFLLAAPLFIA